MIMVPLLRNSLRYCCVLVCFIATSVLAAVQPSEVESTKPECPPDIHLLHNATPEQIALSLIKESDTAFLSDQYCLVLAGPGLHHLHEQFYALYRIDQLSIVHRSYLRTIRRLSDLDTRFMFIHFFIRELSQKMTITPNSRLYDEAWLSVQSHSTRHKRIGWYGVNLSKDMPYQDFMHRLSKAQRGNPQPEDYPAIMKLVNKVIDGNHFIKNDELNALIDTL